MADKITSLVKLDDQWDVSYEIEKNSLINSFCIVILKSDMIDPDSDTEVRTLANARASHIKFLWLAETPSETQLVDENSPEIVTL